MEHSPWKSYDKHVQFQYPTLLSNTVPCSVQAVASTHLWLRPRCLPQANLQSLACNHI